jgi:Double zinc ribbon
MDNLDRMYRHLVRTIRSRFPQYLSQPFDVGELHQTILPYRHHRRELGIDTNEDYEITLSQLLAGERNYLIVDDRMHDVLKAEMATTNPDPGKFKQFASARVALSPNALRSLSIGPEEDGAAAASGPTGEMRAAQPTAPETAAPLEPLPLPPRLSSPVVDPVPSATPTAQPMIISRTVVPQAGENCRACNEPLPSGRAVTFCPHCGQNVTTAHCPACGSELEVGWRFCPTCGRPAAAG